MSLRSSVTGSRRGDDGGKAAPDWPMRGRSLLDVFSDSADTNEFSLSVIGAPDLAELLSLMSLLFLFFSRRLPCTRREGILGVQCGDVVRRADYLHR